MEKKYPIKKRGGRRSKVGNYTIPKGGKGKKGRVNGGNRGGGGKLIISKRGNKGGKRGKGVPIRKKEEKRRRGKACRTANGDIGKK